MWFFVIIMLPVMSADTNNNFAVSQIPPSQSAGGGMMRGLDAAVLAWLLWLTSAVAVGLHWLLVRLTHGD